MTQPFQHREHRRPVIRRAVCALCLAPDELKASHVIPEFVYSEMYDDAHRFNVLTVVEGRRDRFEQKGLREPLLCGKCEQKFSGWERYASLIFKGGAKGVSGNREQNVVTVNGIRYQDFKLFLLSILWRAGVASGDFFQHVELGPHQERLRQMLMNGDPGAFNQYACVIFGMTMGEGQLAGLMIQPTRANILGHAAYHFVIPGFKLVYFVSKQRLGKPWNQFVLQEDGNMTFQVRSAMELPTLHGFMSEFERQGRTPPLG